MLRGRLPDRQEPIPRTRKADAEPSLENLEKLNRLRSLYYAHLDSELPVGTFAGEFFRATGKILMGSLLEHLELTHVEFDRDSLDDDDDEILVHVVVSFQPE